MELTRLVSRQNCKNRANQNETTGTTRLITIVFGRPTQRVQSTYLNMRVSQHCFPVDSLLFRAVHVVHKAHGDRMLLYWQSSSSPNGISRSPVDRSGCRAASPTPWVTKYLVYRYTRFREPCQLILVHPNPPAPASNLHGKNKFGVRQEPYYWKPPQCSRRPLR